MKKAIGFLIILSALALVDGTPIHTHHGKYISNRARFSLQGSDGSVTASSVNEGVIADQDDDDHLTAVAESSEEFFYRIHNAPYTFVLPYLKRDRSPAPLYRLLCDLRI